MTLTAFIIGLLTWTAKLKFYYASFGVCVSTMLVIMSLQYFVNKEERKAGGKVKDRDRIIALILGLVGVPLHCNMILNLLQQVL